MELFGSSVLVMQAVAFGICSGFFAILPGHTSQYRETQGGIYQSVNL